MTLSKQQRRYLLKITAVIISISLAFFVIPGTSQETGLENSDFNTIAHIELLNFEGSAVSLNNFKGLPLVLYSWRTDCIPCTQQLVGLSLLQEEVGENAIILAISRQETRGTVKNHTDAIEFAGNVRLLLDPTDAFHQAIRGSATPEILFIDSTGTITAHEQGVMDLNQIRTELTKIAK